MKIIKKHSENSAAKQSSSVITPGPVFITSGSITGELFLQWDAVDSAMHYVIELSANSGKKWQIVDIVKDPHISMQGLKKGKLYYFRIAAAFSKTQSKWSKPAVKMIK